MGLIKRLFRDKPGQEVPNKEMLSFAVGVAGQNHMYNIVANWFLYFCTDVLFMDAMIIGIVLGVARVWDAINDPLVGVIIDHSKISKYGKLRPHILWSAIPIGICAALMFMDFGLTQTQEIIYIVVLYFVWDTMYSFQDIAQWGLTAMIATNVEERSKAAQFGRIGAMVGGWLPGLLPIILSNKDLLGVTEKQIFMACAIVMCFGGMVLSMFAARVKERAPAVKTEGSPLASLKSLLRNRIVMLLVLANILSYCTLTVQQVYFFKYMVSIDLFGRTFDGMEVMFVFGIFVGLPGTLAMLITGRFSKWVGGMKNVLLIATVANIVCRIAAFFVGYEGIRIVYTGILLAICGIPNGMVGIASTAIWGDSIDYEEWRTGVRNEGAVFSMQNLVGKMGSGLSIFFTGLTLKLLDFDATKFDLGLPQSETFNKFIFPVYMLAPAFGSLLYLIPLLFMKYDVNAKHKLEALLRERRKGIKIAEATHSVGADPELIDTSIF